MAQYTIFSGSGFSTKVGNTSKGISHIDYENSYVNDTWILRVYLLLIYQS